MGAIEKRVAWVGVVLLLCFVVLFTQLNNLQVREAAALKASPYNPGINTNDNTTSSFDENRGKIITSDGVVIAYSKRTNDTERFLRVYPKATARMFSDITGYYANAVGADPFGVEASYNSYLEQHAPTPGSLGVLLGQKHEVDNVYLTISKKLQAVAMAAVAASPERDGASVVAIDPQTGAILAMYSYPNYNPNKFSVHNPAAIKKVANRDAGLAFDPLYNYSIYLREPPGSTMKVITTSAVYDHDPSIEHQFFRSVVSYTFPNCPGCTPLHNYGYAACGGGGLAIILADSCDTAYSEIGDELGYQKLSAEAHAFGFCIGLPTPKEPTVCDNRSDIPPIDLPASEASYVPPSSVINGSTAFEGYSAIGQFDDRATVLQMALVAAAIADNGVIMAPHVVSRAVNSYGETEFTYHPHVWRRATSAATAQSVRQLMTGVTKFGTAAQLFSGWYASGGPTIAAKTGTAEPTVNTCGTYNWLIATGPAGKGETPTVAVAAMVPVTAAECAEAGYAPTGATVAGPVLLPVLQAALAMQGGF
jgi:penicillin-binding protein A